MGGPQRTIGAIVDILTIIFAALGALSLLLTLAYGAFVYSYKLADNRPLKWPTATKDCMILGAKPITDAELLSVAELRWLEDGKQEGETYRLKYVGGPILRSQSHVDRLTVTPKAGKAYVQADLDLQGDIEMRYRLAHQGLRQFARVTLVLKPPYNPDLTVQQATARRVYNLDVCGAALR